MKIEGTIVDGRNWRGTAIAVFGNEGKDQLEPQDDSLQWRGKRPHPDRQFRRNDKSQESDLRGDSSDGCVKHLRVNHLIPSDKIFIPEFKED